MKTVEIINRRCNCKISEITVKANTEERVIYKSREEAERRHETALNINNSTVTVKYDSPQAFDNDKLELVKDFLSVYLDNKASRDIVSSISGSSDVFTGRVTLEEFIKVALNAMVSSGLFNKAAVMFFNDKTQELRGIYIAGITAYTAEQAEKFKNTRVPLSADIIARLMENNVTADPDAYVELEDKIFRYIDNIRLNNTSIIAPMMTGNKLYGVLISYSEEKYSYNHIYIARNMARFLNTVMMAVMSYKKYEYTADFYKETEAKIKSDMNLVTLGGYAAMIAHEVKNPLISIGGFAKRLMSSVTDTDLKRIAGIIATESMRLEHLTEDILHFSKKNTPKKQKIILKTMLDNIKALFEQRMREHNFNININVPDNTEIYADNDQIKQVIVNLITNAMNAMESDGTVTISYDERNNRSYISISDTGSGIPDNILPDLFKPFFTTSSRGTGLGLPISRRILNNHGGDLKASNEEKGGAVFTMMLPKA